MSVDMVVTRDTYLSQDRPDVIWQYMMEKMKEDGFLVEFGMIHPTKLHVSLHPSYKKNNNNNNDNIDYDGFTLRFFFDSN
jgi:hypothetical protein